jgi:hypothetical protein
MAMITRVLERFRPNAVLLDVLHTREVAASKPAVPMRRTPEFDSRARCLPPPSGGECGPQILLELAFPIQRIIDRRLQPPGRARSQTPGRAMGEGNARLGLKPRLAALDRTDASRRFRVHASKSADPAHAPALDDAQQPRSADDHITAPNGSDTAAYAQVVISSCGTRSPLVAGTDFLHDPAVAVGVAEVGEFRGIPVGRPHC